MAGPRLRPRGARETLGLLRALPRHARLCWRLLGERRVALGPKLVVLAALAYVALPVDVVPDVLPLLGQADDLALLLAATTWFVGACPPAVVEEHARQLDR